MMKRCLIAGVVLLAAVVSLPVDAASPAPVFAVTGHSVHAEADKAELCLTFNAPLDVQARTAIAAAVQMEKSGGRMAVTGRDLSLTPTELCVQQLEHRRSYRLTLKNLRNKAGEVLKPNFTLSFAVPERKPSLTFASGDMAGMPHVARNAKGALDFAALGGVQGVNVPAARLKLFHIEDRKNFAAAWQQYAQVTLAPSEGVYFATHNGTQMWEGKLAFGDAPDKTQVLTPPLPGDETLKPGLYFLAVMPIDDAESNPGLLAGLWFTVADLRLAAGVAADGVHVFVSDSEAAKPLAGIALQALTNDGKVLAEARSTMDGTALLAVEPERLPSVALVTGVGDKGDAALLPVNTQNEMAVPKAPRDATIATDRAVYQPGSTALVTLWARDAAGRAQTVANSSLKLVKPDENFYNEQAVPADKSGPLFFKVPLPMTGQAGDWLLLWQQSDGQVLARTNIRVTQDMEGARAEITADRSALDADGFFTLTIKAAGNGNKPAAYRGGMVTGEVTRPEFGGWKNYIFGRMAGSGTAKDLGRFITDGEGIARIKLRWPVSDEAQAVKLTVRLDQAADAATLILPARAEEGWIGVKPAPDKRKFSENSVAAFDIVAVDANGKKQARGDLYFQIYEEGRSFKWLQEDGHWDYQPLPQHRRIGGGRLTAVGQGDARVSWPVTAGHYVLEIADEKGAVLTQYGFDAGGRPLPMEPGRNERLTLTPSSATDAGKDNAVTVTLAQPAMVAAIIGNAPHAQIIYKAMPQGTNKITVNADAAQGYAAPVWVNAVFADGQSATASSAAPLRQASHELTMEVAAPAAIAGGQNFTLPVTVAKGVFVAAVATPLDANNEAMPDSVPHAGVQADEKGRAVMQLAVPDFTGKLQITVLAWGGEQIAQKRVTIAVRSPIVVAASTPGPLTIGDKTSFAVTLDNRGGADGSYAYALTAPEGLKTDGVLKGSIAIKKGQSRVLRFNLTAKEAARDALRLQVSGPEHFRLARAWPVTVRSEVAEAPETMAAVMAPKQVLTLPLKAKDAKAEAKKSAEAVAALISPAPLLGAPHALAAILVGEPFTTSALAEWIDATRRWQEQIVTLGLAGAENLQAMRQDRLDALRQRQNYDDGFPASAGSGNSDLSSTIAALRALKDEAPLEAGQAARWVRHYLDNTWFDESERGARAAGFRVLGLTGQVDSSALRYFADTSREKNLPPLAAAELAMASAQNHDDDSARFWAQRAQDALPAMITAKDVTVWPVLAVLAENWLVPAQTVASNAEAAVDDEVELTPQTLAALLRTADVLARRSGTWHLGVNGPIKNLQGVFALSLREKGVALVLRTPVNETVHVLQVMNEKTKMPSTKSTAVLTVQRQLYHLDGTMVEAGEGLAAGEVYLLMLHGQSKGGDKGIAGRVIINPASAGLQVLPPGGVDAAAYATTWAWLPPLTAWDGVMATNSALSFAVPAVEEWRVVALVRAVASGAYNLPPVTARALAGERIKVGSGGMAVRVE